MKCSSLYNVFVYHSNGVKEVHTFTTYAEAYKYYDFMFEWTNAYVVLVGDKGKQFIASSNI